jgi:hypothetical protein
VGVLHRACWGKLGGAHRFRFQNVSQLQAEVPRPLTHDLPGFLSPARVATPTIGILFDVFVFQGSFKGPTMEVERHHIGGGEGALGKIGPEEFIDETIANEPDLPLLFLLRWGGVGGHNDADEWSTLV